MTEIVRRLTVGYVRSARKSSRSIEAQEKKIKEYCNKQLLDLDQIISDNGMTGNSLDRPGLTKLLKMVAKYDVCRVICVDSSRLSRDMGKYISLKSNFKQHETDLVLVDTPEFDEDDPLSKTTEELIGVVSSLYPRPSEKDHKKGLEYVKSSTRVTKPNFKHRFTRQVTLTVDQDDLQNHTLFSHIVSGEPLYASTCGLSRSQLALIAKILHLNLENNTEVKAVIDF